MVFFCVDIGTTSLKAAAITETGSVVFFTRRVLSLFAESGDSAQRWFAAFVSAATEYVASDVYVAPDSITVSGNGPTLVAVDQDGAVCKTFLWNEQSPFFDSEKSKVLLHNCRSIFVPRILALQHDFPAVYRAARFLLSGPEYLTYCLTGVAGTSLPEVRYVSAYWCDDVCRSVGIDKDKLPPFFAAGECAGGVTAEMARLTGFVAGTPVLWGLPDFLAAVTGTGAVVPGVVCDRAGTSEGLNVCVAEPPTVRDSRLRVLPSVVSGLWNVSYLIPNSGRQFADFMCDSNALTLGWDAVMACIARSYGLDFGGTVAVSDVRLLDELTPATVQKGRAILDSLVADIANGIALLRESTGFPLHEVRMCGGQAVNDTWCSLKAHLLDVTVVVPRCRDAELLGSAMLATVYGGVYNSVVTAAKNMSKSGRTY